MRINWKNWDQPGEEKMGWGESIFKQLQGSYEDNSDTLFSVATEDQTKSKCLNTQPKITLVTIQEELIKCEEQITQRESGIFPLGSY